MAEERRRRRPTRLLWVALFALLLWLLLQLNQFLPGVWPGGGEDKGLRPTPAGPVTDPTKVKPSDAPLAPLAHGPPTVHVVVRMPDGTPMPEAALGVAQVADPNTEEILVAKGSAGVSVTEDRGGVRTLFVRHNGDPAVEHGGPPAGAAREWVVQMPRASVPARWEPKGGGAPALAPPFAVAVRDALGAPIPGATLDVRAGPADLHLATGADGMATLPRTTGVFRICASAPRHGSACGFATTYADGPLEIRLPNEVPLRTRFVDDANRMTTPISARALRLIGADGTIKVLERAGGEFADFQTTMPADIAAKTSLEIEVAGRPLVRVPLDGLSGDTVVPAGRLVTLTVSDESGAPRAKARVEVRYEASSAKEPKASDQSVARFETDAEGHTTLPLPVGKPVDVRVEADGLAPGGLSIPATASGDAKVVLVAGLTIPLAVRGADGAPIAGADVIAIVKAGDSPARRLARTGDDGTASLGGVPAGRVEIYAHKAGLAWAYAAIDAAAGMAPVALVLKAGSSLHLIVDDPRGVPLPGVAVRSVPAGDAAGSPDPMDPDGRPWITDENGVLSVNDLSEREIDLYLSKAGYSDEIVPRASPGPRTYFATLVATK